MLSRALSLATVMLLVGCFAAAPLRAQNLEAGKAPSQIFSGTCTACHKSPRGLLKTVAPGSLPGFLRQHYTTSSDMAASLSAYLVSNGAADTRLGGGGLTKQGKDAQQGKELQDPAKPGAEPVQAEAPPGRRPRVAPAQEAAKPDADGIAPGEAAGRQGRNAKRLARPGTEPSDAAKPGEGHAPAAAVVETGPNGKPLTAKQKLSKRGKHLRDEPAVGEAAKDTAKTDSPKDEPVKSEAAKSEPAKDEKPKAETAKSGPSKDVDSKPVAAKAADDGKAEAAKPDGAKTETPALRADPVPAVTPAPKVVDKPAEGEPRPAGQAATPAPAASASGTAPSEAPAAPAPAIKPAPPAVQASAPPQVPAGPPAPPISQ